MHPNEYLESLPAPKPNGGRGRPATPLTAFADRHGFRAQLVGRQIAGKVMPTLPVMAAFFNESGGRVTVSDWSEIAAALMKERGYAEDQ